MAERPSERPKCPNFSSGPCAKRPGYNLARLPFMTAGRSHRSLLGRTRIKHMLELTRNLLQQDGLPASYLVGMVPASDTGAMEMAMWSLLGPRPVTVAYWESFGKGWFDDAAQQLKLTELTELAAPYGQLPDLRQANWAGDVVFPWNGTTSGVRVPHGEAIPVDRLGLTICDATSGVFAQNLPWNKLDVVTFSWQKCLGSEGAHGMLVLSPRAVDRLHTHTPGWPVPKIFRLTTRGSLITGIFEDSPINTPSMLVVEDAIDALEWAVRIGGHPTLVERADTNVAELDAFVAAHDWAAFLAADKAFRSNTSVCLVIKDLLPPQVKQMAVLLDHHEVAFDIESYRDAPPGLRIWCGPTVECADIRALLPWLIWAHDTVKAGRFDQEFAITTT